MQGAVLNGGNQSEQEAVVVTHEVPVAELPSAPGRLGIDVLGLAQTDGDDERHDSQRDESSSAHATTSSSSIVETALHALALVPARLSRRPTSGVTEFTGT